MADSDNVKAWPQKPWSVIHFSAQRRKFNRVFLLCSWSEQIYPHTHVLQLSHAFKLQLSSLSWMPPSHWKRIALSLQILRNNTYMRSSTSRLQTPASITAWILSFGPSDRYESAQHASAKTSESAWNSRRESTGRHGLTLENSGGGFFPRHRFDRAHTAFRVIERRVALLRSLKII